MQWQEQSVILSTRSFGENARIVTVFNRSQGKTSGLLRSSKTMIQSGDICDVLWKGRKLTQLGMFKIENIFSPFPFISNTSFEILALNCVCALCENGLPDKAPHKELYGYIEDFILNLVNKDWLKKYVLFEKSFLTEVGVGLDLSKCALTKKTEGLFYVSPRTGRAVTKEVGEKYKDRLFILPKFLTDNSVCPSITDILNALKITQHFLQNYFHDMGKKELPWARSCLIQELLKGDKNENQHYN